MTVAHTVKPPRVTLRSEVQRNVDPAPMAKLFGPAEMPGPWNRRELMVSCEQRASQRHGSEEAAEVGSRGDSQNQSFAPCRIQWLSPRWTWRRPRCRPHCSRNSQVRQSHKFHHWSRSKIGYPIEWSRARLLAARAAVVGSEAPPSTRTAQMC